ncbi:MAG: HTH-type transcriptional regulator ImmR [Firmicutes bacterium ADurb.Bin193]|nr:MAG: HTH-type transcriptional regulator ImmR [Firmicutes bacterium ADurb.Bin193]
MLAKRIKELRVQKGLTQQKFAEMMSLGITAVNNYENGNRTPSADTVIKMAKFFGVPSDYLLGLSDIKSFDIENMSINKKLGLTQSAINKLKKINAEGLDFEKKSLNTLNLIIDNMRFEEFLYYATAYAFPKSDVSINCKKSIDLTKAKLLNMQEDDFKEYFLLQLTQNLLHDILFDIEHEYPKND